MLTLGFNNAYDTAIIVSGDGDYIHAVDRLKALGMSVEVAIFENVLSPELRRAVDLEGVMITTDRKLSNKIGESSISNFVECVS